MTSVRPTANAAVDLADHFPDSADELQAVVRAERTQLKLSLDELGTVVRKKVDVRSRLFEHPAVTVGAAVAAGVLLGVLSNKVSAGDRSRGASFHGADRRTGGSSTSSSSGYGRIASTIFALAGRRLADIAEDTVRDALAHRRRRTAGD